MSSGGQRETRTQQRVVAFFRDEIGPAHPIFADANLVRAIENCRSLFGFAGEQVVT